MYRKCVRYVTDMGRPGPCVQAGARTFGRFEQDNRPSNGPEPIEWIVLDYDATNNRVLLVSLYGLHAMAYSNTKYGITWKSSPIRDWLNGEFLDSAFTKSERECIVITDVHNGKEQSYRRVMQGSEKTRDRLFLLSYAEANKYLNVTHHSKDRSNWNMVSRAAPTAYAIACGAQTSSMKSTSDGAASGNWWLRSPSSPDTQEYVRMDGAADDTRVNATMMVRPALWLDLNALPLEN